MSFSFFELLFLISILLLVYFVHPRIRKVILLAGSMLFCCKFNEVAPITLAFCTILTYLTGLLMEYFRKKSGTRLSGMVLTVFVVLSVASMSVFKVFPAMIRQKSAPSANYALEWLFMSIGFSYYMFQAIGYLTDIHKGRISAEKDFISFALFMAFFPKIISGPIGRAGDFIPKIASLEKLKIWDLSRFSKAVSWILYGFFMKTLLADRIGPVVSAVFNEPVKYSSSCLILTSFLYTLQIYLDFAGYSAVAIGVGKFFDLELSQNFNAPYLSKGFGEFWRRWHMTLSSWLRDYIYIPLGGNRKGKIRKYINTLIVFIVCGIWHGSGGGFLIWGIFHGCFTILDDLVKNRGFYKRIPDALKTLMTFLAVSFAWIFFGVKDAATGVAYVGACLTHFDKGTGFLELATQLKLNGWDLWVFIIGIIFVIAADILSYKAKKSVPQLMGTLPYVKRLVLIYFMIMILIIFGVYGPGYDPSDFIYMRF
ncbi:MAG: MBOAT family protein [Lachnospiraceae bacterium]|nr:MBOAT family protein [Lachnospiraceae bacterium]